MSLLDRLRGRRGTTPEQPRRSDMIELVQKSGAKIYVSKEDWRTKSLPATIRSNWNDPEQLSTIVVGSVNDGFHADVLEAAEHLYQIDPVPARGACIYGIVLMKNDRLDDAERILLSHIQQRGEDGAVLTNLAKIHSARKDTAKSEATLWHALEVDPNQENGFAWYAALGHERAGKQGMMEAWQRVAALPGSWRAQLWLARIALESREPQRALTYYRESLARVGERVPTDFLMQLSGDLGKHGLLQEVLDMCEPLFVPEIHGLQVGNNLIKANLALGHVDSARRILNQLRLLQRLDWLTSLSYWETEIEKSFRR